MTHTMSAAIFELNGLLACYCDPFGQLEIASSGSVNRVNQLNQLPDIRRAVGLLGPH